MKPSDLPDLAARNMAGEPTDLHGQAVTIGRYLLHRQIARGGMATIHIARLLGDEGFSRIVAAKRLLPEFAEDADFVAMFLDEARVASKVHHRNVVPVLDVVTTGEEAILVQEYVHGVPLHWLLRTVRQHKAHVPVPIAVSIGMQVLAGLHAAHETVDEMGVPLHIVHRDVSPQNVMISVDGSARLLDFGVAKATMAAHITREGTFKGKVAYSAPEQLRGAATRQSDVYSLSVLVWELVVGHRMHQVAMPEQELVATVMAGALPSITEALDVERDLIPAPRWAQLELLEPVIEKGLAVSVTDRYATAEDMEQALQAVVTPAPASEVAAWVKSLGKDFLDGRDRVLAAEEASWRRTSGVIGRRSAHTMIAGAPMRPSASRLPELSPVDTLGNGAAQMVGTEQRRRPNALIALLCALVVALAIGIVIAVRYTGPKQDAAAPPPTGAAVQPLVAPATNSVAPATNSVAPVPVPPAPAPAPTEPPAAVDLAIEPATAPAHAKEPAPAPHKTVPRAVHAATAHAAAAPPAVAPPAAGSAAPTETAPAAKPDCNPPYYFQGSKKVFKPACI